MIIIEGLEKQLKNKELNTIYLLYGEERYLLESMVKKIKTTFGELVEGINYIQIDETNIKELISNIETPAFGFEKKLILIKNTGLFKREVKKKGIDIANMKERLISYLPENKEAIEQSVLVFIEESVDKGKLLSTFEELKASICNFEYQKPAQISARIKAICNAYAVQIADRVISYFIETVGTSMQDVINEIRKQIEYAGERGTITKEAVDILCHKQLETVIFELTDNLGKKEIKKALEVLHHLLYQKEPIQKILITLYHHFQKIYLVKLAIKQNRNIAEALNLKPNQMFLTTKYKMQSNSFEEIELRNILQELIQLDANYKVGRIDLEIGLEAILCGYCS